MIVPVFAFAVGIVLVLWAVWADMREQQAIVDREDDGPIQLSQNAPWLTEAQKSMHGSTDRRFVAAGADDE